MQTSHQVMGMVTKIDLTEGHVRLKEDNESFCTLCCSGGTHILGEEHPLALDGLQPGDYIRGECMRADRKSTRLNSSHIQKSRMPSSA